MTYKFVHKDLRLLDDQKKFYEENGYIIIRNNVPHDVIDRLYARFVDICEERVKDYQCYVIKDPVLREKGATGEKVVNKLQDFTHDKVLGDYCFEKGVLDVVENIIGPNITAAHSMVINKPPDSDPNISSHPLHQDLHYFPFRPANKIVASWTAMERTDKQNGCLYVVPGSHKNYLYPHQYPKGLNHAMYHGVQGKDHLTKVYAAMDKGDTIFFHPLILHGSGPNFTKGFRKAISVHFADSNCHFIDVTNTSQENIKREVEAIAEKKSGMKIDYKDVWKLKSRLIRGPPGNFQKLNSHL